MPAVLGPVIASLEGSTSGRVNWLGPSRLRPAGHGHRDITVSDTSPEQSARIANEVAESLSRVVEDVAPKDSEGRSTVRATTVAMAEVPSFAVSPMRR